MRFMLESPIDGHEYEATRFEDAPDGLQDMGQVGFGNVQQAVKGIDGVEVGAGKVQVQEIHDVSF